MTERTALYRHFDAAGNLLYVGISKRFHVRLDEHVIGSRWSDMIATATVEHFDTRESALDAERNAIKAEKPIYNIAHNDNYKAASPKQRISKTPARIFQSKANETADPSDAEKVSAAVSVLKDRYAETETVVITSPPPPPPDGDYYIRGISASIFYGEDFHTHKPPPTFHQVLRNGRLGPKVWLASRLAAQCKQNGRTPYQHWNNGIVQYAKSNPGGNDMLKMLGHYDPPNVQSKCR